VLLDVLHDVRVLQEQEEGAHSSGQVAVVVRAGVVIKRQRPIDLGRALGQALGLGSLRNNRNDLVRLQKTTEDYRRLQKTTEDYRRLQKTTEDYRRPHLGGPLLILLGKLKHTGRHSERLERESTGRTRE
jgi:Ni/Co efflux regulator RcnB